MQRVRSAECHDSLLLEQVLINTHSVIHNAWFFTGWKKRSLLEEFLNAAPNYEQLAAQISMAHGAAIALLD